jgi:Mrp family chromosome partitioning ATPase
MTYSQQADSMEPAEFLPVLRRRWWIVIGMLIVGGVAAAGYLKVAHKEYTSTASVYVTATGADTSQVSGGRTSGTIDMDSEAQLVQSITVATIAAHIMHTTAPPAGLTHHVTVTVPANSEVLQISCTQHTADQAAACAQAFANAYLQNRSATSTNELNAQLKSLRTQVAPLQRDVANLQGKIASLPTNSPDRATAQAQLSTDQSQLSALTHQIGVLSGQQADSSGGSIITSAAPAAAPTTPKRLLILPSGLVAGLLLGLLLAFWVDRRDKRIHGAADLQRGQDLPVLATLQTKQRHPQPTIATPRSQAGRMFAQLADSTTAALGEGNHVLFVAGTSPGASTSVTAANLSVALARTHSEVVLVCADLNQSATPDLFGLDRGRGLAEVLAGKAEVWEVTQRPADFARLQVIPPGLDTSVVLYNFQHDVNRQTIADLRKSASVVVIEAQSAGGDADTFPLAEFADTALVVAEIGSTTRPEVAETLLRLSRLRTPVLGAVLLPRFGGLATVPPSGRPKTLEHPDGHAAPQQRPDSNGPVQQIRIPALSDQDQDLSNTRPIPLPVQQAVADQHAPLPDSEQAEPTGKNAES